MKKHCMALAHGSSLGSYRTVMRKDFAHYGLSSRKGSPLISDHLGLTFWSLAGGSSVRGGRTGG